MHYSSRYVARLMIIVTTLSGINSLRAQTEYTGDGLPTGLEEEIRWRVNRGRFDTASENQARGTNYTDVPSSSGPLAPNQSITLAARHHSEDMAKQDVFQHATVTNSMYYSLTSQPNPWDRMGAEGYSFNWAAENIAAGYPDAESVYVGWFKSATHRVNMYNDALREIGNGYFYWADSTYERYYTMDLGSSGNQCFFTDTLFHDANQNGSYEQTEGKGGIEVTLNVGGVLHSQKDRSTAVGSFAVPLQSIRAETIVYVVLSNTTPATVTLSLPADYHQYSTVTLAAGESREVGGFMMSAPPRNFGFRDLATVVLPLPMISPPLTITTSGAGMVLSWPTEPGVEYQLQWTTDFRVWTSCSTQYETDTGSQQTYSDPEASSFRQKYYRLSIRRP